MRHFNQLLKQIVTLFLFSIPPFSLAAKSLTSQDVLSVFPLDHYNQSLSFWIKPAAPDFNQALMNPEIQKKYFNLFLEHYVGSRSPWQPEYVNRILWQATPNDIKSMEENLLKQFSNENKPDDQIGYGENFRPHTKAWINHIANNINLSQFDGLIFKAQNRGIAITNLHGRALPTEEVHFYNAKYAGQGYPFDNLQVSSLWAGTPVYIVGETRDHTFLLVITPDFLGWVKQTGIARTDDTFVNTWTIAAKNKLAAITKTKTSIIDKQGNFLFSAYVGSVFPARVQASDLQIMVPIKESNQFAKITFVNVSDEDAALMPLLATPHHFSNIIHTLIGRPYGWGGMYFYNDCSAELKSLMTPFGIWLPRHSSDQVHIGKMVDMSAASPEKRLSYLMKHGEKFLTLIYIGGHVMMYIGNYPNPNDASSLMAMTYQNVWGLKPNPPDRRAVIGQSVLFPMLLQYPEDKSLTSLAAKKYFQVSNLNGLPQADVQQKQNTIDLRMLMYPEILF